MRLLVLPSHRVLILHSKSQLRLLPGTSCEQYTYLPPAETHRDGLIAMHHYKSVSIYNEADLRSGQAPKPIATETFMKKVEVLDLLTDQNNTPVCVVSDKFGDIYRLRVGGQEDHPVYVNSNLGIPKYIRHLAPSGKGAAHKEYLILGDEENRIKVYNANNIHELISVWFMVNMFSVECHVIGGTAKQSPVTLVLLLKYFNKLTLESRVHLHCFEASAANLEAEEYPGKPVPTRSESEINIKQCRFFTSIPLRHNQRECILLLFLCEAAIHYELFTLGSTGQLVSAFLGQAPIEQGKWDYLYGVEGEEGTVVLAYGADVEMPAELELKDGLVDLHQQPTHSLNQYEKIVKIQLPK